MKQKINVTNLEQMRSVICRIIATVIIVVVAMYFKWLTKPAINVHSEGMWWYLILVCVLGIIIMYICECCAQDEKFIGTAILAILLAGSFLVAIIGAFSSSKLLNAKRYSNLINIENGNFEEDITKIEDTKEFPLLDVENAKVLGSRAIGELDRISQYELSSEYNLIDYKGEQYRLTPIDFRGYFKARNSYSYGVPGYVLVNSGTQQAELVKLEKSITYSPKSKGNHNLKRYLRGKYPSYIFGKYQFDIDDKGNPYYIVPVLKTTIGLFGGKIVNSFVVVNAISGDCNECSIDNLPKWVDHAYSLDYLMTLASYNYKYKDGFWNSIIKQENVKKLSYSYRDMSESDSDEEDEEANSGRGNNFEGYNSIQTSDGICFSTCVVSAGNDESSLGFILANARTGEIKFYDCVGAEESTAQKKAESLVQNYNYTASYPLIVNVDGMETYILSLKDKSKTNVSYVMINVEKYTVAVTGETLKETLYKYKKAMGIENEEMSYVEDKEEKVDSDTKFDIIHKRGNITQIYQVIREGNTTYIFLLEGDNCLYVSSINNNLNQVKMKEGTEVDISYYDSQEEGIKIVSEIEINANE